MFLHGPQNTCFWEGLSIAENYIAFKNLLKNAEVVKAEYLPKV